MDDPAEISLRRYNRLVIVPSASEEMQSETSALIDHAKRNFIDHIVLLSFYGCDMWNTPMSKEVRDSLGPLFLCFFFGFG
jgi:hypothetical protein